MGRYSGIVVVVPCVWWEVKTCGSVMTVGEVAVMVDNAVKVVSGIRRGRRWIGGVDVLGYV